MTNRLLLWLASFFAGGLVVLAGWLFPVTRKLVTAAIFGVVILLGKVVPYSPDAHPAGPDWMYVVAIVVLSAILGTAIRAACMAIVRRLRGTSR
jgi:hypothetical protein